MTSSNAPSRSRQVRELTEATGWSSRTAMRFLAEAEARGAESIVGREHQIAGYVPAKSDQFFRASKSQYASTRFSKNGSLETDIPVYYAPPNITDLQQRLKAAQSAADFHNKSCDAAISEVLARGKYIAALKGVAVAALEWIDAVPPEQRASLPEMPGFNREWADNVIKNDGWESND